LLPECVDLALQRTEITAVFDDEVGDVKSLLTRRLCLEAGAGLLPVEPVTRDHALDLQTLWRVDNDDLVAALVQSNLDEQSGIEHDQWLVAATR
jgi:hypothetical protein